MKIFHIGSDSHFVDYLVARFERLAPGANVLVQATSRAPRPGEFTGPSSWVLPTSENVDLVVEQLQAADVVVVHAMSDFAALVCAQLPPEVIVVWSGFGFDYYRGEAADDLYGVRTLNLLKRVHRGKVPDRLGRLVVEGQPGSLEGAALDMVRQTVARRTDFFSAPAPPDLDVFTRAFPGFRGEYRQLNYGDIVSMCRAGDAVARGNDILVGNSAAWTNNHLETFRRLADTDLGSRRVVVPLTYGDNAYRDGVVRGGERLLGEHFFPIVEHLPIEEYLDIVAGCGVAVFLHRRQQGLGNIVAAVQQGTHVYLDRRNPLYAWLRELGLDIHRAAELQEALPEGPVDAASLARHREVLAGFWGTERVEANLARFVAELEKRVSASARRARRQRVLPGRRNR